MDVDITEYIIKRTARNFLPHPNRFSSLNSLCLGTLSYAFSKSINSRKRIFRVFLAYSHRSLTVNIYSIHPLFLLLMVLMVLPTYCIKSYRRYGKGIVDDDISIISTQRSRSFFQQKNSFRINRCYWYKSKVDHNIK